MERGILIPPCCQHFFSSSSVCGGILGNRSGNPGRVGGTRRRSVNSAAAAINAVQIGSVGMSFLTKNMSATCTPHNLLSHNYHLINVAGVFN